MKDFNIGDVLDLLTPSTSIACTANKEELLEDNIKLTLVHRLGDETFVAVGLNIICIAYYDNHSNEWSLTKPIYINETEPSISCIEKVS